MGVVSLFLHLQGTNTRWMKLKRLQTERTGPQVYKLVLARDKTGGSLSIRCGGGFLPYWCKGGRKPSRLLKNSKQVWQ
jgi:hypothetical protein